MKRLAAALLSTALFTSTVAAEPNVLQDQSTQEFEGSEQIDYWNDTFLCSWFPYTSRCAWMPAVYDLYTELLYGCSYFNEDDVCKELDENYVDLGECSWAFYDYSFFDGTMHTLQCHRCAAIRDAGGYWTVRADPAVCQVLY